MAQLLPLPNFIALRPVYSSAGYLYYVTETEQIKGYVQGLATNKSVYNEMAKIEVEQSKINRNYVHLKFCHTNKYWARGGAGQYETGIVCVSNQPEEDTSKWSCTLFEPVLSRVVSVPGIGLKHVASGRYVNVGTYNWFPFLASASLTEFPPPSYNSSSCTFTVVDWDTLVIMPKHVAFKGYNDKYLKSSVIQRYNYHQFSSDDWNENATAYEVTMNDDGYLRISSNYFDGRFWRRSPNWIWADSTDTLGTNIDTLFWPVRVDEHTIGVRNAGNNRFCSSLTADGKTDCLNAAVTTITREARLVVEELVFERDIFRVIYHFDDLRIFNENAEVVGDGNVSNATQQESVLTITISFEDSSSYSFSNSLSIMAGVSTKITTGIPRIVEGEIAVSTEITNSFEWDRTTTNTRTVEASLQVVVPPRSRARVDYVATRGTCNLPFSYTQRDRLSGDGRFLTTQKSDGIFTGINYYSFFFDQPEIQPM